MTDRPRILVTGATGETGRRVVAALAERNLKIRALARNPEKAAAVLDGFAVELHIGDVRKPESLHGMAEDVDAVIHTIGTRTYFGANGGAAVDVEGVSNLVDELAGVCPHLVFLSAFGVARQSPFLSIFSTVLGGYFVHKARAEALVRAAKLPWTIVRPVELRNRPPRGGPRLNQSAPLSLLRTVSRDLVAETLVRCALDPASEHRTFELCEGGQEAFEDQLRALQPDGVFELPTRTPLF